MQSPANKVNLTVTPEAANFIQQVISNSSPSYVDDKVQGSCLPMQISKYEACTNYPRAPRFKTCAFFREHHVSHLPLPLWAPRFKSDVLFRKPQINGRAQSEFFIYAFFSEPQINGRVSSEFFTRAFFHKPQVNSPYQVKFSPSDLSKLKVLIHGLCQYMHTLFSEPHAFQTKAAPTLSSRPMRAASWAYRKAHIKSIACMLHLSPCHVKK